MKRISSRKKSKKPSKTESCTYSIEILDWELPYSFSINSNKKMIEGPFWEHMNLKLTGRFVYPEKLINSTIEVILIGDRRQVSMVATPENYQQYEPKAVGGLTVRGKQREFIGSIPFDVLNNMSSQFQAGGIKFFVLDGQPLYRGSADIKSIHFSKDFIVDEWT